MQIKRSRDPITIGVGRGVEYLAWVSVGGGVEIPTCVSVGGGVKYLARVGVTGGVEIPA
jgi:hypothetical protein